MVITGVGLVSCFGEGLEGHLNALENPPPPTTDLAGYPVHSLAVIEFDKQIPKKELRQMEGWQKIGVYAAGLALDMAGLKADSERLSQMHMIVAAGGGERDLTADSLILNGLQSTTEKGVYLNDKLASELRPTLFLAQLSNLLAGNISIVHGVTGSSRTFMGEEQAGVDAVDTAFKRIKANQGECFLVGGSYNAERLDIILHYVMGGVLHKGDYKAIDRLGMILGSVGAFLVVESREHAVARGATILSEILHVASNQINRETEFLEKSLSDLLSKVEVNKNTVVFSNSSFEKVTNEAEKKALNALNLPIQHLALAIGSSMEAAFPAAIALATLNLQNAPSKEILITNVGHYRGEAVALVKAAS